VRVGDLRGWREAVLRARELWPEIPEEAFIRASELPAEARTYEQAEWFTMHPVTAAELAVRALASVQPAPSGKGPRSGSKT
jgi:hypothetical protein